MQRQWKLESFKFVLVLIAKRVVLLILRERRGQRGEDNTLLLFQKQQWKVAFFYYHRTERVDQIPAAVFVLMKVHGGRAGRGLETQRRKTASEHAELLFSSH